VENSKTLAEQGGKLVYTLLEIGHLPSFEKARMAGSHWQPRESIILRADNYQEIANSKEQMI